MMHNFYCHCTYLIYFYHFAILLSFFLQVKERPDVGVYVKDLSAYVVNNADDLDKTMSLGNKNSKKKTFSLSYFGLLLCFILLLYFISSRIYDFNKKRTNPPVLNFDFFFASILKLYPNNNGHSTILGSVGATNMNAASSRSHAIFTITIERSEKGADGQQHLRMGKLHMVDLAVC